MNHATCSIWRCLACSAVLCLLTASAWHPCELLTLARDSVTQVDVLPNISGFPWLSYYSSEWYWPVITTELFLSRSQTARLSSLRFPSNPRLCVAGFKGIKPTKSTDLAAFSTVLCTNWTSTALNLLKTVRPVCTEVLFSRTVRPRCRGEVWMCVLPARVSGFCEHGNEPSGQIQDGEFN
jgi:hypothetical protein